MHGSTKTFGHEVGLSCCFRQHRATSHCNQLHGYAIKVVLHFEARMLDRRNWVVDFGDFSHVREWLKATFDHTVLVAQDDPQHSAFEDMRRAGIARVITVQAVGCEAFALLVYQWVDRWLWENGYAPRCVLRKVEVHEHGANSASYTRDEA
jgi:6-pyruvoyltetrahydropterin/6-carboxytetrahydropterin synthase